MAALHDRTLLRASAAAAVGAAAYWLPAAALVSAHARRLFGVRATVAREDAVALTFDDGPHPEGTPAVLEALERLRAPATFFLAGEQVARYPTLAAEIIAAGHEAGVHCQRHRNLMRLTPCQVRDDLLRATELIAAATGRQPRYYRPPYGILTTAALTLARRLGWEIVLWRRDGHDWEAHATPTTINARILHRLTPGDIILLHDADHYSAPGSWQRTAASIDRLGIGLHERRLAVAELANREPRLDLHGEQSSHGSGKQRS
jgi:peptidoglycan/xylan/chitin deacetylase (PgdA/CDA1 family)